MTILIVKFSIMVGVGALIGWFTNYLAVKGLFHPIKPINIFGFKIQGLIPKRKNQIIENIGEVVATEFITTQDLAEALKKIQFEEDMDFLLDKMVGKSFKEKASSAFPMAGLFLTPKVLEKIKNALKEIALEHKDEIIQELSSKIEQDLDIKSLVIAKVEQYPIVKIEDIIVSVARKELQYIEIFGGVLGALIGIVQFLILQLIH